MAPPSPRLVVPIDLKKKPWEQKYPLHNRWHPRIPPVADVAEGEVFRVEMTDWTGGSVADNDSAMDIKSLDLTITHYLSGPLRVSDKGGIPAKPGDLLAVEICNLGPLPGDEWGYTATFDRENGGGFLTDHFPSATKAIWYFEGIYTYSPQIPGVRFPGLTHPGIVGTAPSLELLNIWNEREKKLAENGPNSLKICEVVHQRPLANLPTTRNCLLGMINDGTPEWEKIANEAARTIPGRENGGNCDIKNLSRGSKIYLPVFVEGANLSTGDMHFSQGDGEVSFCGAIEMSGFLELKCEIIRGGMKEYLSPMGPTALHVNPIFEIGPVEPRFSEWLVFEGISVDESGRQHFLDATVAYKRAVLNAIDYLSKFGYSKEQAYLLLSCCPCEGRISGIVDTPNAVATIAIPIAIFDQDIRPNSTRMLVGPRIVKKLPDVIKCSYDGDLPITPNLTPMGPTELHVNPIFEIGPVEPRFSEWLVFEGISVDESGRQHFMDATVAYKRAVLNAIDYLSKFGYSKEQAYLLISCCPCEGRLSGIVDIPNAVATIAIPTAIFDQDIRPKSGRVPVGPRVVKKLPDVLRCSYDGDLPITQNLSKGK